MAQRRASFMTYGDDEQCNEIRKFIEEAGILLTVRDMKSDPLSVTELNKLLGHIPVTHFLNQVSPSFAKKGLDKGIPEREEVIRMIAEDPSLLRRPIVKTTRLIMAGCDKKKLTEMLQLNQNSNVVNEGYREQPRRTNQKSASR